MNSERGLDEAITKGMINQLHRYMSKDEPCPPELEMLKSMQDQFREAAIALVENKEFKPCFEDYQLSVCGAMMEKMLELYKKNGNKVGISNEMEALHLLTLMDLAEYLTTMTRPDDHPSDDTALIATNTYYCTEQIDFEMSAE